MDIKEKLRNLLQKHFGYNSFRPLQEEAIQAALENRDSVVLMPTGGGKSLCYQLPAMHLDGLTLVVSPLIALMKDQVQSLVANGIKAAFLNSSVSYHEEEMIVNELNSGEMKLLYVAPERLFANGFMEKLKQWKLRFIAIDEAHCISSWGHHFRPEYKKLSVLKELFPDIPVMALTATADKAVRTDIADLLSLNNAEYFIGSFDRPNISLSVLPGQKKWEQILRIISKQSEQSGIIYCSSRAATETLSEKLKRFGYSAECYHAGMESEIRSKVQEAFIRGDVKIIVATIAFGMGIDKSNVRYVIHHNMPGNLDSYYQELGRAGRDGLPAEAVLFYSYRDVQTQLGFIHEINDDQYREILELKLKRMQEYAEAQVCRRKILLNYFSDFQADDCGNCDVCNNPPEYFDGTIAAQMALSAVARSKEQLGVTVLVDVLKGFYSQGVKEKAFHQLKTYGAGKQYTTFEWQHYIQQFIQQGLLEIDYKDSYHLKLTELSKHVLFEQGRVRLVTIDTLRLRQKKQKEKPKEVAVKAPVDESLFEHLKKLRKQLADEIRKPAFVVFSDVSLRDMCSVKPTNKQMFLTVNGVGDFKAEKYAEPFVEAIKEYEKLKA